MKKYLEYRLEIEDLERIGEVVKTEEKIAASQLRLAKKALKLAVEYRRTVSDILSRLTIFYLNLKHPFLRPPREGRGAILLAGEKGLVGGLSRRLIESFLKRKRKYSWLVVIGKEGIGYLGEEGEKIDQTFSSSGYLPGFAEVWRWLDLILVQTRKREIFSLDIFYPSPSSFSQPKSQPEIALFPLLPLKIPKREKGFGYPVFEPRVGCVFDYLLGVYLQALFYQCVLEAKVSELTVRALTTEDAFEKLKRVKKDLSLFYFKTRRQEITQRQLESFVSHRLGVR